MDDTAQEIRQREEQSATNETPDIAGDGDGGDVETSSGSSGLPVPSVDRRHLAVIAAVVALIVAWKLYQRQSSSAGGGSSISEEREKLEKAQTAKATPDDEERERIDVPIDPSDPLAADRAVTEALRSAGKLHDPDQ